MGYDRQTAYALGRDGEKASLAYLSSKGFRVIERGFRFHRGEIDLIAWDRTTLVFVEVKTRTATDYGRPEESITPAKQRQLRKIAQAFLAVRRLSGVECRFDVLSLVRLENGRYEFGHYINAF